MSASHMELFQTTHSLASPQLHAIDVRTQHSAQTLKGPEKLASCDKKLTHSPLSFAFTFLFPHSDGLRSFSLILFS